MKISVRESCLVECSCDAALISVFEDDIESYAPTAIINETASVMIRELIERGDFRGKMNQLSLLYPRDTLPVQRIVLIGLGKRNAFTLDTIRGAYAKAAQHMRSLNLKKIATSPGFIPADETAGRITEAIVEGVMLGSYQFNRFKTLDRDEGKEIEELILAEERMDVCTTVQAAAKKAETVCNAVSFVRDLVSMPANAMTPTDLANEALAALGGKKRTHVTVMACEEMQELGMNALLAVAGGSSEPAKFIVIEYKGGRRSERPLVLVGKAITFDSGGISLKPAEGMDEMKSDMAGGAAVIGVIMAASDLHLPVNCIGLIPATENKPGSAAYRPGDILRSLSGKTIEVLSTDAEGRLILADALAYARRFQPEAVIDVATLTGACVIALGDMTIGMMGTSDDLKDRLRAAGDMTGERVWELPLWEEYYEQIKSDVADFKNTGGRPAGTITAACFLSKFVGDYPWVHLDIAGPAWLKKDRPYIPKGASGVGVRLLVAFLQEWSATKGSVAGKKMRDDQPS